MSRGINFDAIQPDEQDEQPQSQKVRRIIVLSPDDLKDLTEEAKRTFPFFAILLPRPGTSQIGNYIRTYWQRLDQMSGSTCLLLSPLPPEHPTDEMKQLLVKLVGEDRADAAWARYHADPQTVENETYELADKAGVDFSRLPCLVLMTNLDSNQKLIQRLPVWEAESLTRFFEALLDKMKHHRQEPDLAKRLDALKADLGLSFMLKLQAEREARGLRDTLAKVEWSEVIKSVLTNQELLTTAFKVALGVFGLSVG